MSIINSVCGVPRISHFTSLREVTNKFVFKVSFFIIILAYEHPSIGHSAPIRMRGLGASAGLELHTRHLIGLQPVQFFVMVLYYTVNGGGKFQI